MHGRWWVYPIIVVGSLMLSACGGGGGGGSDPADNTGGGGSGNTAPQTLQFIEASSSGLLSHNPVSPGSTTVIDADADFSNVHSIPVLGATWNNGQTDAAYVARVVYQDSSGHLQQVSTDGSGGVTPTPQQISENTYAACQFNVGQDFADSTNARVAYKRCDTGEWWWTRIGASPTEKPKPFNSTPLVDLVAVSDGSHDGWLVLESGEIKRVTPNGTLEAVTGSPTGVSAALHLESIQDGSVLLNIDGKLWVYNPADGLSDLSHSFVNNTCFNGPSTCPKLWVVDASEFYFIDNNTLYGTDLANDQVEQLDQAVSPATLAALSGQRLAVNSNRVVWSYVTDPTPMDALNGDNETVLRTIEKSSGTASDLRTVNQLAVGPSAQNQPFFDRTGEWFFYTRTDSSGAPTAVAERLDGSGREEYSGSVWQGGSVNLVSFTNLNASVNHVFMVGGGLTTTGDYANENLKSVSGSAPGGTPLILGTTPSDMQGLLLIGGFTPQRLAGMIFDDGGGGTQRDIFYLDAESAGSLQRLTSTNNEHEDPSSFF